jgi:hypothetical protein
MFWTHSWTRTLRGQVPHEGRMSLSGSIHPPTVPAVSPCWTCPEVAGSMNACSSRRNALASSAPWFPELRQRLWVVQRVADPPGLTEIDHGPHPTRPANPRRR